jgi:uncharacterized protein YbjT (DUF2867 family)
MKVLLFGATGMIGQGVLRECLLDPQVTQILVVGRVPTGVSHPKLREFRSLDLFDLLSYKREVAGYDVCLYCVGIGATSASEVGYTHITYDLTMVIAKELVKSTPGLCFIYLSRAGAGGSSMWARVKGQTEKALFEMPFARKYAFRPGLAEPVHGARAKSGLQRFFYGWLFPLVRALNPNGVTTTEQVGRAMLEVAKRGAPKAILENDDINALNPPPKQLTQAG